MTRNILVVITTQLIKRLALALTLMVGGTFVVPDAVAAPTRTACKKKRAKAKAKKAKKVTAKNIKAWQKKGLTDEEIVKLATEGGYKVTKKETKKLKKLKVRTTLVAALSTPVGGTTTAAAAPAPKGPEPIDIDTVIDPNDIDFDSVPPPKGMDMRYADAHRAEKGG